MGTPSIWGATMNNSSRHSMRIILCVVFLFLLVIVNISGYAESWGKEPVYVGVEACRKCHQEEYKRFMTYARKSRSFESVERLKKRLTEEEIRECYSCHTTGYGRYGGFISPEKTPHLKIAGCEVCHGPGGLHVKTMDPKHIKMRMTLKDCEVCHIEERVRAFRYKPLIRGGAH